MIRHTKYIIGSLWPALRSRNYRLYFVGQGISLVGTWMATVAEQWLIYPVLTSNRSLLGIVSAVNLIPTTCLVLFAGVIADRVDKRKAQIIIQSLFSVLALILATLVFTGSIRVWHVMVAAFFTGVVFAFDMPTRQSLMVGLVEKKDFASALSLNAGIFNVARAIGPAVAGLLIATIGIAPAYFLNCLSFIAVIISIAMMRLPKFQFSDTHVSLWKEFKEGIIYIRENKIIAALFSLLALETLFTWPTITLLPVFTHDIFQQGEVGFGILQSVIGVGAMLGAFGFSTIFHAVRDKYRLLTFSFLIVVVSLIIFSFSSVFAIALTAMLVGACAITIVVATINTLVQTHTPDALRGRMMSFYSFVLVGGMPFGALLGSVGVTTIGARLTAFTGAVLFGLTSFCLIGVTRGTLKEKLAAMV